MTDCRLIFQPAKCIKTHRFYTFNSFLWKCPWTHPSPTLPLGAFTPRAPCSGPLTLQLSNRFLWAHDLFTCTIGLRIMAAVNWPLLQRWFRGNFTRTKRTNCVYWVIIIEWQAIRHVIQTETNGSDVSTLCTDVDWRHYVDHEVNDVLPVVDAADIVVSYAARVVDNERYIQQTHYTFTDNRS